MGSPEQGPVPAAPIDLSSLFGGQFDMGDLFGGAFGGGAGSARGAGQQHPRATKGQDIQLGNYSSFFWLPPRGAVITFNFSAAQNRKKLSVTIPAGVEPGSTIRLKGQGHPGMGGGPGRRLIIDSTCPHLTPTFDVKEKNLLLDVPITPWEAALGEKVEAPTLSEGKRHRHRPCRNIQRSEAATEREGSRRSQDERARRPVCRDKNYRSQGTR